MLVRCGRLQPENCEPALATVLFVAGAGGSLRAGATRNPVHLTRAVGGGLVRVTLGGAPAYVYPGGGITVMVDVAAMPDGAFGHVPTPALVAPALVAPMEFTMTVETYAASGGHLEAIVPIAEVIEAYGESARVEPWRPENPWPFR